MVTNQFLAFSLPMDDKFGKPYLHLHQNWYSKKWNGYSENLLEEFLGWYYWRNYYENEN